MTPEQARVMIENVKKDAPDKLVAACNTIALESITWAEQAKSRDKKLFDLIGEQNQKIDLLIEAVKRLRGGKSTASGAGASAASSTGRTNADGSPMTAAQAAAEDEMDAAAAGMGANPNAPAPTPVSVEAEMEAEAEPRGTPQTAALAVVPKQ